jgi:predicted glutamine amidotransferase
MCRVLGYCSREQISVSELLGEPGLAEFTALSCAHSDGWGMAALDGAERRVAKSPQQASADPEYHRLAKERLGDTGLVHLRWATPGLPVEDRNTHPFVFGEYAFAHNGAIHPQDRLPQLLPPAWEQRLTGTTDTERYFLHIMSGLEANGSDVIEAVADAVRHIRRDFSPTCLNAILLGPDALYAISWHDPDRIPYDSLREPGRPGGPVADPAGYFHLGWRISEGSVVVASTGWPQEGWNFLPNGGLLVVERESLTTSTVGL